jgi:hypothetical protein
MHLALTRGVLLTLIFQTDDAFMLLFFYESWTILQLRILDLGVLIAMFSCLLMLSVNLA